MDYFAHVSAYIDDDVQIGSGTKIWHFSHIQRGSVIGENCTLGQNVNIAEDVEIGNNCRIQNNVSVYHGVTLENGIFCGPSCVFTNDLTPRAEFPKGRQNYKKTMVRHGASIGANATIVCGHTIGEYAMIGAGAVVASDVPAYTLMLGIPAKPAGVVCRCGCILKRFRLEENVSVMPDETGDIVCKECGQSYRIVTEKE